MENAEYPFDLAKSFELVISLENELLMQKINLTLTLITFLRSFFNGHRSEIIFFSLQDRDGHEQIKSSREDREFAN